MFVGVYRNYNSEEGEPFYQMIFFETTGNYWSLMNFVRLKFRPYLCLEERIGLHCRRSHFISGIISQSKEVGECCQRCARLLRVKRIWISSIGRGGGEGVFISVPVQCISGSHWNEVLNDMLPASQVSGLRNDEEDPFLHFEPLKR